MKKILRAFRAPAARTLPRVSLFGRNWASFTAAAAHFSAHFWGFFGRSVPRRSWLGGKSAPNPMVEKPVEPFFGGCPTGIGIQTRRTTMSRKFILTFAAAATIAVATLASQSADARGFGGGSVSGAAVAAAPAAAGRRKRRFFGGGARKGPLHGPRGRPMIPIFTSGPPRRPGPHQGLGHGHHGTRYSAAGAGLRSTEWSRQRRPWLREARSVHLPDQELYAGRSRGVRGYLHQGIGQRPGRRQPPTRPKCRRRRLRQWRCRCRWCRRHRTTPAALMKIIWRRTRRRHSRKLRPRRRLRLRRRTEDAGQNAERKCQSKTEIACGSTAGDLFGP